MAEKTKIALIYSGQPRHVKKCNANHRRTFYEANPDAEIDVFAHTWIYEKELGPSLAERQKNLLRLLWQPKDIVFEEPRTFNQSEVQQDRRYRKSDKQWPIWLSNALSMFYSLEMANNLKREYEKRHSFRYDYVVRLRTDTYFPLRLKRNGKLLSEPESIGPLEQYDFNKINVHKFAVMISPYSFYDYGLNDQFAIGGSELMDKYSDVYSNFLTIHRMGSSPIPEAMLGFNVQRRHGLPVAKHPWTFIIYRHLLKGRYDLASKG